MRVLVTGAGGTVGGYIVGELLKNGHEVIATDLSARVMEDHWCYYWVHCQRRSGSDFCHWVGDLTNENFVNKLFYHERMDAIIHTAALIDVSLSEEKLLEVNCEVVKALYNKLKESGDNKVFVFLSSGSIYGKENKLYETSAIEPVSAYEISKVLAEKFLEKEVAKNSKVPRAVILRPSLIYGPYNKFLAANYLGIAIILSEFLGRGMPKFFGGPKTNLVHAKDVARASVFLLENKRTHIIGMANVFNICDDSPLGFGDHLSAIISARREINLPISIPLPPAFLVGLFKRFYESERFIRIFNKVMEFTWDELVDIYKLDKKFTPGIDKAMTSFFGKDTVFSNKKIKSQGFRLEFPNFEVGIKDVISWYRDNDWIP